jgi:hypothetical protein
MVAKFAIGSWRRMKGPERKKAKIIMFLGEKAGYLPSIARLRIKE